MIQEKTSCRIVDLPSQVPDEVSRLLAYGLDVGFDLETTGLNPINDRIVTIAFKPKGKAATVIDVRHWTDAQLLSLGPMLSGLFDGSVTIVGQNLKFDLTFMLAKCGLAAKRVYDVGIAEQVIMGLGVSSAAEKGIHFSLDAIGKKYGVEVHKEERSWFIDLDTRPEWDLPLPEEQIAYIRQDVSVVHRIKAQQMYKITEYQLEEVIMLEMRTILPLVGIEYWGVQINREGWLAVIDGVTKKMKALEWDLHLGTPEFEGLDVHVLKVRNDRYMEKWQPYEVWMVARDAFMETSKKEWESGEAVDFDHWSDYKKASLTVYYAAHGRVDKPTTNKEGVNLGSWMQVRDGFNDLFADIASGTDDGPIVIESVSEECLEPYRELHPLVGVYIDYTHARKIVTNYGREKPKGRGKAFIEMLDEKDRLRPRYQQIGADTERMSGYDPNLQQAPDKGVGADLRKNVVAAPGYTLVDADFSNIELRVLADVSGDKFLLDAFKSGQDIHAFSAITMFKLDIPEGEDTKKWTNTHEAVIGGRTLVGTSYRKASKTGTYALLYGAGVKTMSGTLGASEADTRVVLSIYYKTFATAIAWLADKKAALDRALKAGEKRVFAQTRAGWRRWFDIPEYPVHPANKGSRLTVDAVAKWQEDVDAWKGRMAAIKRQLANTPIQGLSAAITKEACAGWYEEVGYDDEMRLIAVIHDELLVEATLAKAPTAVEILERVMVAAMDKYLKVVDKGDVDAVLTPYWSH